MQTQVRRFGLLPAAAFTLLLVGGCLGAPSPSGQSAAALVDRFRSSRMFIPDECGYIFTGDLRPNSAEEWVSAERPGSDPQADAVIRGPVMGLELGPSEDRVSLVVRATSVHGTTDAHVGDTVRLVIDKVANPGALAGASWKDNTEAIMAIRGRSLGSFILPSDHCDPMIIGDGTTADLVTGFGWFSSDRDLWGLSDLDELEDSAVQGLS